MKISKEKKDKISEQILSFLYSVSPKLVFTSYIASEIARDEEFVKKLLLELKKKGLIMEINKNPKGKAYKRRARWKLTDSTFKHIKQANEYI